MFNHVLAPLDGSALAECILPHTVALARAFGSEIVFIRVVDETNSDDSARPVDPVRWQIDKQEATAYLDAVVVRLSHTGVPMQTVLLEGHAAERIVEYAQTHNIDLIVLSSHGRSGLSGWNMSSIAQKIMLRPAGSTMVVRAYQPAAPDADDFRYHNLLVPLDGSLRAESAVPVATTLAQYFGARLIVAHVVTKPEMARRTPPTDEDVELANRIVERNTEEANAYLDQLRARTPVQMETRLLYSDSASSMLQEFAESEDIDLVILSAHGYTGRMKWPYGSVVTSFTAYGTTPVLIVQDAPVEMAAPVPEVTTRHPEGRPDAQF